MVPAMARKLPCRARWPRRACRSPRPRQRRAGAARRGSCRAPCRGTPRRGARSGVSGSPSRTVQSRSGSAASARSRRPASGAVSRRAARGSVPRKRAERGRTSTPMRAACARYAWRQPMAVIRSWTTGADAARANPFADCTTEIAMPRRWTYQRESSGTKTTRPRQLAPIVITNP